MLRPAPRRRLAHRLLREQVEGAGLEELLTALVAAARREAARVESEVAGHLLLTEYSSALAMARCGAMRGADCGKAEGRSGKSSP